uniref:Uncharacterized protein n=1 Tax=Arundo donax TaxID=35708 RepID=A0A0A9HK10_ARUDO
MEYLERTHAECACARRRRAARSSSAERWR